MRAPVFPVKASWVTSWPSLKKRKLDVETSMYHSEQCQSASKLQLYGEPAQHESAGMLKSHWWVPFVATTVSTMLFSVVPPSAAMVMWMTPVFGFGGGM